MHSLCLDEYFSETIKKTGTSNNAINDSKKHAAADAAAKVRFHICCSFQRQYCCCGVLLRAFCSFFAFSLSKDQRCSPSGRPWPRGRHLGHILKSLALASKLKFLALALNLTSPQKYPVLCSTTALFLIG